MATDVGRLLDLCQEALALDTGARRIFLDQACAGDIDLRRAVDALLAEESQVREFLETPAWSPAESRITQGTRVGPYEVLALAGAGAMGEVYKARDTRLDRTVAIKVLPPRVASDPARRARFKHEGRAVSALNHSHICTLYDIGSEGGLEYLVMEYLEGEALAARLTRRPVPLEEALEYAIQMADALAYAHVRGIIHRDLKPANVMLTAAGAKLLDFGIAKLERRAATSNDQSLTVEGLIVGTIAYMAPEQLGGTTVDARSDLFSFGAVLYEMFTGRQAFQGASQASVIAAVLKEDPPAISSLQPATPPAVDDLVRKCLAKAAPARWQSAAEVVEELRRIRNGSALTMHRLLRGHWLARRRVHIAAGAIVAVIGAGFVVRNMVRTPRFLGLDSRNSDPPAASRVASDTFARDADVMLTAVTREPGAESFPSLAPDGREFVYSTGPLDYFGESDIYRRDVGLDRAFNLTPDSPGADVQPAFSPNGDLIAFRSDRDGGGIFLMRRDGSAVRRLTAEGYNPAWSPDGAEIAYATIHTMASPFANRGIASAVWIVNVETGARRLVRGDHAAQPSWSPHGHRIAYWAGATISTCTPNGGNVVVAVDAAAPGESNWDPVWSRDGRSLYFVSDRNGPMHLWRVSIDERSGRPIGRPEPASIQMPSTFIAHPSFDASGSRLLFASVPETASIQATDFDVAPGVVRSGLQTLTTGSLVAVWPEPSPDGTRLAFHSSGDTENIYISAADGSRLRMVIGGAGIYRVPRWSPDGRRLAFYSSRGGRRDIWVVDADGANPRPVTKAAPAPIVFPAWSPDGRMAASEARPGSRSFIFNPDKPWDEPGNVAILPRPDRDTQFIPWSWSPTGDRLAGGDRLIGRDPKRDLPGVMILTLATGKYTRVTRDGTTPVWLPDGHRLLYGVNNTVMLVDLRTGRSREVLNVGTARLEMAAGGGFSVSAAAGRLYVAPVVREGDIWFARPR